MILNSIKKTEDFTINLHDSDVTTNKLYEHLQNIDLKSAQILHPNDRRKIIR